MAAYNEEFSRPPADPRSAFVPCEGVDLDHVLCHEEERTIGQDNVVTLEALALQLAKQPGRRGRPAEPVGAPRPTMRLRTGPSGR
jgi:hypothetical protein